MRVLKFIFIFNGAFFFSQNTFSQIDYEVEIVRPKTERHPSLSPNGNEVVFCSGTGFDLDLKVVNLNTGEVRNLTVNEHEDSHPRWSPDGEWIVFQRENSLGNRDLFLINKQGKEETNLTNTPNHREQHPCFSANGFSIVFDGNRDEEDLNAENQNYEIYLMKLANKGVTRLTFNESWDMYPSLNKDGTELVWRKTLVAENATNHEIFVMNLKDQKSRNITDNPSYDSNPHWNPEGDLITFASNRDNGLNIYTIKSDGTGLQKITNGVKGIMGYGVPTYSYDGKVIMGDRYIKGSTDFVKISTE